MTPPILASERLGSCGTETDERLVAVLLSNVRS
jgi:hypothetical protein